jgi:hypothetical protein
MIPQRLSVPIKKEGRLAFHSQPSSDGLSSAASSNFRLLLAQSHLTRRLFGAMVRHMDLLPFPAG